MNESGFSLIIPIYNEESTVEAVLNRVLAMENVREIVLVNDGSQDRTGAILDEWRGRHPAKMTVRHHETNRGKGAAIRTGIAAVRTTFAAVQDADLEYDPADLNDIFRILAQNPESAVFGSRFLIKNPNLYWTYLMGNKVLTAFINVVAGGRLTDAYTCYKALATERWRSLDLAANGFEIEAEIVAKCLRRGIPVIETPIRYNPRTFQQGKKIRGRDAIKGMVKALECRLFDRRKSI